MPEWRTRAVELFPELREELTDGDAISTPYALWFELRPLVREAHRAGDDHLLRRIYGYAAWSYDQGDDLENAVAVSFYEHVFDERWLRPLVVPWLSERVIEGVRPLWELMLSPDDMREVEKLIGRAR